MINHNYDIHYGMELSILNTYLFANMMDDNSFMEIMDIKLDENLFTKTVTNKATAKAIRIHQDKDYPIDEHIIKEFLDSKMVVNELEFDEILKVKMLLPIHLKHYLKVLEGKIKENTIKDSLARI